MRLPDSNDTRLLLAGIAAVVALLAYLAVAFANMHIPAGPVAAPDVASEVAPFVPSNSKLVPISRGKGRGFIVQVIPAGTGFWGALAPTLVAQPQPGTFVIGLSLRAAHPGGIGIEINEFRPEKSLDLVSKTVPATAKWHRFTFTRRVSGQWLGLGLFVSRHTDTVAVRKRFEIRGVSVRLG